jgi:hypothetical protein
MFSVIETKVLPVILMSAAAVFLFAVKSKLDSFLQAVMANEAQAAKINN